MSDEFQFSWIPFYQEFSDKLLLYKNDRKSLIEKIKKAFDSISMELPKLECDDVLKDIDPFTVFGLFNKYITDLNRQLIIGAFINEFVLKSKVPNDFDGVPKAYNLKASFYGFKDNDKRKPDDIENLWNLFSAAIEFADSETEENRNKFCKWYDLVHDQRCIKWNMTMGLFWIRPYKFVNLDEKNRDFLKDEKNVKFWTDNFSLTKFTKVPSATEYLTIRNSLSKSFETNVWEIKDFPHLSYAAFQFKPKVNDWYYADYDSEITKEDWLELLKNSKIFNLNALQIMKRMKDIGGSATCKQLSNRYGETWNFYNAGSSSLAQRIAEETNCAIALNGNGKRTWWPILYVGKDIENTGDGCFLWKLRDELSEALDEIDLDSIPLYAPKPMIWKISEGTEKTGIADAHKKIFLERQVVVVHSHTKAKGISTTTQGEDFINKIKKGDYFYLCFGNKIKLLGQFESDEAVENPEIKNGWFERKYRLIKNSIRDDKYTGEKYWWTPDDNSTCIAVKESKQAEFESQILKPYFAMTLEEMFENESEVKNYWWLTANPKIWNFSNFKIGEEQFYTLYNDNNHQRKIFKNFLDAKAGDLVIGYEATPVKKIVAIAEISKENDGKNIYFKKKETLSNPIDYSEFKDAAELKEMEFLRIKNGSLFKLSENEYNFIMDLIREQNPIENPSQKELYAKENFLDEVFLPRESFDKLQGLLKNKLNVILQGAPGVGKTFAAKRLAYAMMGEKDDSRIELVQFHQNYSYEDFVLGYRPKENGFSLERGTFFRFCQKAENEPNKEFFFIIDEINRGNLSKIFGELMMLIEKGYRETKVNLAYNQTPFSVPKNVYIIGMMNTADRSLAMIDYALRRRFSFFEMSPGFDSSGFQKYQQSLENETFDKLIFQIKQLNSEIEKDNSLGKGFRIGHSYFCEQTKNSCTQEWMRSVVDYDIIPMLEEYWFDESEKVEKWKSHLEGIFND